MARVLSSERDGFGRNQRGAVGVFVRGHPETPSQSRAELFFLPGSRSSRRQTTLLPYERSHERGQLGHDSGHVGTATDAETGCFGDDAVVAKLPPHIAEGQSVLALYPVKGASNDGFFVAVHHGGEGFSSSDRVVAVAGSFDDFDECLGHCNCGFSGAGLAQAQKGGRDSPTGGGSILSAQQDREVLGGFVVRVLGRLGIIPGID